MNISQTFPHFHSQLSWEQSVKDKLDEGNSLGLFFSVEDFFLQKYPWKVNMLLNLLETKNLTKKNRKKRLWEGLIVSFLSVEVEVNEWITLLSAHVNLSVIKLTLQCFHSILLSHSPVIPLPLCLLWKKAPLNSLTFTYSHMLYSISAVIFMLITNKVAMAIPLPPEPLQTQEHALRSCCKNWKSPIMGD